MPLVLAICGASGRIGSLVVAACQAAADLRCGAALVSAQNPQLGRDVGELLGLGALGTLLEVSPSASFDVLVDLALPGALAVCLEASERQGKPLVIGATGHDAAQLRAIEALAQRVPVLLAPNLALGASLLMQLVHSAAACLGSAFEVSIEELHHVHKLDAPSGTARALAQEVRLASGIEAVISSKRQGQVVGEHSVCFSSPGESLTLSHSAKSPALFAEGALAAARWIVGQPAGLYGMQHVLQAAAGP